MPGRATQHLTSVIKYGSILISAFVAGLGVREYIAKASGMEYLHRNSYLSKEEVLNNYINLDSYNKLQSENNKILGDLKRLEKEVTTTRQDLVAKNLDYENQVKQCIRLDDQIEKLSSEKKWLELRISRESESGNPSMVFESERSRDLSDLRRQSAELQERIIEKTKQASICTM
ncbi:hypothetical protein ACW0US_19315 [Xanthomonas euvesicatoria]